MIKDLFSSKGPSVSFKQNLKKLLHFTPSKYELYVLAFTHSSVVEKDSKTKESNERLEFLGDSILGSIVAEYLFKKYPYKDEGFLTDIRSRIVKRDTLNDIAIKIGVRELLIYNKTIFQKSIYGNAFEALIGAIYLDKGYSKTTKFVQKILNTQLDIEHLVIKNENYKSILLEWISKNDGTISFNIESTSKSESSTNFKAFVKYNDEIIGEGIGNTKKSAEQAAAEISCNHLNIL